MHVVKAEVTNEFEKNHKNLDRENNLKQIKKTFFLFFIFVLFFSFVFFFEIFRKILKIKLKLKEKQEKEKGQMGRLLAQVAKGTRGSLSQNGVVLLWVYPKK